MSGTVTSQLTNVTLAETGDSANWDDIGGGPGSAQSDELPIQGAESRARRADNVTVRGFSYDSTTGLNLSADGTHVGFWVNVLQPSLIITYSLLLGSEATPQTSPWSEWDIFDNTGNRNYPEIGGWQRVWIDPTRTRSDGAGILNLASIRQFGCRYDMGNVGGTSPNMHLDRIDYLSGGGGLLVDSGTVPSPAVFNDFILSESINRYGVLAERDGVLFCRARLILGDDTATIFNDSNFVLIYADQRFVKPNFMGLVADLQNASTDISISNAIIRSGGSAALDNRGDFGVTGTNGTFSSDTITFDNLRRVFFNNACTLAGCSVSGSGQIDPTNQDYSGSLDLPGTDEYVTTLETVNATSPNGELEIIMHITPDDWTPASTQALMSLYGGTTATESFRLQLLTTSDLRLVISDGTTSTNHDSGTDIVTSSAVNNGIGLWIKADFYPTGTSSFWWSADPVDTPIMDITWTSIGGLVGSSNPPQDLSRVVLIGAENDTSPTAFFTGSIEYADLSTNARRFSLAGTPAYSFDIITKLIADWRTGPDFSTTDNTRPDDYDSSITWELNGTAPVYTPGDGNTDAADMSGTLVSNTTSEAALLWNVNTDPDGYLDNMSFISDGDGFAIELGPKCPSTITLIGHSYTSFAPDNSDIIGGIDGNEVIINNSGKAITINVTAGDTPTYHNGVVGSSTTVNNTVAVTLTGLRENTEVRIYSAGTQTELAGIENATDGSLDDRAFTFNVAASIDIDIKVFNINFAPVYLTITTPTSNASIPIAQGTDRVYDNPT